MAKLLKKSLRSKSAADPPPSSPPPFARDDDDEFHDAPEAMLHPDAHEEGGIAFVNKELLEQQRGAIVELIKDMGRKILSGNLNLINMSLPVKMFEPRSYLEKLADVWVYPQYLEQAAQTQDPAQRIRFIVTWFIAGLQHAFQSWRKPFNPILGETWQAALEDGTEIFMEQISHHPPISAFQMTGPGGAWLFSGLSEPDVRVGYRENAIKTSAKGFRRFDFPDGFCLDITYPFYMMRGDRYTFTGWSRPEVRYKGNAIRTTACGCRSINFPDGSQVYLTFPYYYIRGIMYTSMPRAELVGTARFVDHKNRLACDVVFGKVAAHPEDPILQRADSFSGTLYRFSTASQTQNGTAQNGGGKSRFSIVKSLVGGSSSSARSDEPELLCEQVLSTATGNWLSYLDWDGHRFWTLTESSPAKWGPVRQPLPSDSALREDLQALQQGTDPKDAQLTKEKLENLQRNDAKLRKPFIEALVAQHSRS